MSKNQTILQKVAIIREATKVNFQVYDSKQGLIDLNGAAFNVDRVLAWVNDYKDKGYDADMSQLDSTDKMYLFRTLGAMC